MSKTVVISQSNYIPWKGYFSLILFADIFVFLDDVQYTKRDWRNRNRIKTPNGLIWLSIPCSSNRNSRICDVEIKDTKWQEKHWKSIIHSYGKAKYFKDYKAFFEKLYLERKWTNLSELNQYFIKLISKETFNINTVFQDSRDFNCQGKGIQRIFEILGKIDGVTNYLTGPSAKNYISGCEVEFLSRGIQLQYMDYSGYSGYNQLFGPFIHEVSVLDLIFNTGPNAKQYLYI